MQKKKYKSIKLILDSSGAIFESDIDSIILFDCEIIATDIAIEELNDYIAENKLWWIGDKIEKAKNGYRLDIFFTDEKNMSMYLRIGEIVRTK